MKPFFTSKTLEADDTILKWTWLNLFVECFFFIIIFHSVEKNKNFGKF